VVLADRQGGGLIVVFVAALLALLGALMIVGFVVLLLKLGALGDEIRDARTRDAHDMKMQLDAITATQQGTRLDLARMTSTLQMQGQSLASLAFQLEGPPSMRRPILPHSDEAAKTGNDPPDLAPPVTASPH